MSIFIRILGAALAAFLLLGGLQEWKSLGRGLFTADAPAESLPATEREEAARTVLAFAQLSAHFYSSGGDRRFAERLPAAKPVVGELVTDAAYVRHNGRIQEPVLVRMQVERVESPSADRAEVLTREYWTTRYILAASHVTESTRADVVRMRYRLIRDAQNWTVVEWEPEVSQ